VGLDYTIINDYNKKLFYRIHTIKEKNNHKRIQKQK